MEYDKIIMSGEFLAQTVSTLPSWTSNDERRILYVEDENKLYYGSNTQWTTPGMSDSDKKKYSII